MERRSFAILLSILLQQRHGFVVVRRPKWRLFSAVSTLARLPLQSIQNERATRKSLAMLINKYAK